MKKSVSRYCFRWPVQRLKSLNQPLASLLEDIELMEKINDNPEKTVECINRMKVSGQKISGITRKINTIHYAEPIPSYYDSTSIVSFDREINILVVDDSEDVFEGLKAFFERPGSYQFVLGWKF